MESVKRFMIVEVDEEIIVLAITDRDQHVNMTLKIFIQREYEFSSVKTPNMEKTLSALLHTHHQSLTENTNTSSYNSKRVINTHSPDIDLIQRCLT